MAVLTDPFPTDTELAEFQAAAELGMRDACTVKRQTGTATDPNTGVVVPVYVTNYTGKCRVKIKDAPVDSSVGEQQVTLTHFQFQLPVSVVGVRVNDIATITASLDADLVGRTLRIASPWGQTHATMRRFACEESTLP